MTLTSDGIGIWRYDGHSTFIFSVSLTSYQLCWLTSFPGWNNGAIRLVILRWEQLVSVKYILCQQTQTRQMESCLADGKKLTDIMQISFVFYCTHDVVYSTVVIYVVWCARNRMLKSVIQEPTYWKNHMAILNST